MPMGANTVAPTLRMRVISPFPPVEDGPDWSDGRDNREGETCTGW